MSGRAIFWFRRDLSLRDNLAWAAATTDHAEIVPLYVLDRRLLAATEIFRRQLLTATLHALDAELRGAGGKLTVVEGIPEEVIPQSAREHSVSAVVWNADVTGFAQVRDAAVARSLASAGVESSTEWSTLVHPPGSIHTAAGTVPRVFGRFHKQWDAMPVTGRAEPAGAAVLALERDQLPAVEGRLPFAVGSVAAEARLHSFLEIVDDYEHGRDRPDFDATSRLSADLRFGSISPREVARAVGTHTSGRRAFVRQLAWRDWYAHLFHERPDLVDRSQQPMYEAIAWRDDPAEIAAWKQGATGYPIVDAAMRELATTGWMHNRLRMIAASFLVKDLLVDWRIGERHFRRLLLDGDVPQNAGNWQWSAGTGPDAAPYFRILNPVVQARRFDPHGDYVRRWVPELARLSDAAIHAPCDLGPLELAGAGVTLGDTYPWPIVDHAAARERALAAYAAARAVTS